MAADETGSMCGGLESSLWSSDTCAGKLLNSQKKYRKKVSFIEDLVSYLPEDP